jgi:hypothetical protein
MSEDMMLEVLDWNPMAFNALVIGGYDIPAAVTKKAVKQNPKNLAYVQNIPDDIRDWALSYFDENGIPDDCRTLYARLKYQLTFIRDDDDGEEEHWKGDW